MKRFLRRMFNSKNRIKSIAIIAGVVIAIIAIILLIIFNPFENKNKKIKKELEGRLVELAGYFYENQFYPKNGDDSSKIEFVKGYVANGVKVDLLNIARSKVNEKDSILAEFKNADGELCDNHNTKVTIYPKEPYGVKDYEVKVFLECNFDKKNNETTKKEKSSNTTVTTTTTTTVKTTKKKK